MRAYEVASFRPSVKERERFAKNMEYELPNKKQTPNFMPCALIQLYWGRGGLQLIDFLINQNGRIRRRLSETLSLRDGSDVGSWAKVVTEHSIARGKTLDRTEFGRPDKYSQHRQNDLNNYFRVKVGK